jgi:4-alpha-glucanotransferase
MNECRDSTPVPELARRARHALGIDDLVLAIHDASFPSDAGEDIGRGTPYSRGARRLIEFAGGLGFTGLQLGPQGVTTGVNRSPYDGTVFSRSPLSISLEALAVDPSWEGLVDTGTIEAATSTVPPALGRAHHAVAEPIHAHVLELAFRRFLTHGSAELHARFEAFCREAAVWLDHDAAFEAHAADHGSDDPSRWRTTPLELGPNAEHRARSYAFAQFVVHAQHAVCREQMHKLGWKVFGDLQVGLSLRDLWRRDALFLDSYAMGAPPSRTDPQGQAWGYAVLRPDSSDAAAFFRARIRKMAREYDGIRIDHPHGLVCPWVYDRRAVDPLAAVRAGARLFESPDLPDHPSLAAYALVRPDQIDRSLPRHHDRWVRAIEAEQLEHYRARMAVVIDELSAAGRSDVVCEVLSTAPTPLLAVMDRHGLGRFRVTQKADLYDPRDGYRSENAQPRDWIMVGTHDTRPLARVVDDWWSSGETLERRAAYLADRLVRDERHRPAFARALAGDRRELLRAMVADLFASPARHVLVFMSDLFGLRDVYNRPGVVSEDNWSLRLPNDFERVYRSNLAAGTAMDVLGALALALRASAETHHSELASELERAMRAQRPDHAPFDA